MSATFIDLFAGIGGIRIGFERNHARCVLSCEWDRWARKTYEAYFQDNMHPFPKDIRDLDPEDIPNFDVLTAGFPCQPFSIAGVSKKSSLGREHGFKDEAQGTLFFDVANILEQRQPKAFLLENVKNLLSHDRGNTWRVIQGTLRELGYITTYQVINASDVVPQNRERVFIVGYHQSFVKISLDAEIDWTPFWEEVDENIQDVKRREQARYNSSQWPKVGAILQPSSEVDDRYILTDRMWEYLQAYKEKHQKLGNGFGYGLVKSTSAQTRTISARYYKDGSEALVYRGEGKNPRRLTPVECARLQGFPQAFEAMFLHRKTQPVSDTQAYKQFGNSVCVPVVQAIAHVLLNYLRSPHKFKALPQKNQLPLPFTLAPDNMVGA